MLSVADYIKLILKKKKWTRVRLCKELNKVESKLGDSRTTTQNITNYLNGYWEFRPKILVKYEKALGLKFGTLINMVSAPISKDSKRELKRIIEKIYEGEDKK